MEVGPAMRNPVTIRGMRRAAWLLGAIAVVAIVFGRRDLQPNLARVNVAILSGSEGGNYHALVSKLAAEARRGLGSVENIATPGSVENVSRLAAARDTCRVQFALVQDGLDWPQGLELVARLPRSESVFFLGRDADRIHGLADLRGLKIGIGPDGSGTALLARNILQNGLQNGDPAGLGVVMVNVPLDAQLSQLERGQLDLGVVVMDEDAVMIQRAVRERGLAIMSFPFAEVVAHRMARVHVGRIAAGTYDLVRVLPPADKTVLQVDTLVLGNGCAKRTATTGLLTLLTRVLPDVVTRNRETATATLPLATASRRFFENGGPDLATQYLPWAVDIMPLSNWIYVITAVSLLFNGMSAWNRFRLWQIDARRMKVEERLFALFGPTITPAEIGRLRLTSEHRTPEHRAEVADLIATLEALSTRCRQQSVSFVSDMGQEMRYRYQEHLMTEFLEALRSFRGRVDAKPAEPGSRAVS